MTMDSIPQDIFQLIRTFLSNDDYHYFLNSSKILFEDLKRKTIFFKLNRERSYLYAMNKEFQDVLLSKVEDGWNQICIYCNDVSKDTVLSSKDIPIDLPIYKVYGENATLPFHLWNKFQSIDCKFSSEGASEIPPFPNVKDLHLRINPSERGYLGTVNVDTSIIDLRTFSHLSSLTISHLKVKDITPLKDIPVLSLSYCGEVTDFSALSNQRELTLSQCLRLTDVSSFRSVRKLSLNACPSVSDVSPLKGIYDLTLHSCSNIKDISCLGNHHRLSLAGVNNSSGFDVLLHIPHVILIWCDIEDVSVLRFAKSVTLLHCNLINSISPLKNVKTVSLMNSGKSGLTDLGEVPDLYKDEYKFNDDPSNSISSLHNKRLSLTERSLPLSITSLSVFSSSIQHLHIIGSKLFAKLINDGQGVLLQHLLSLTLVYLPVMRLEGLGHIPTVRIMRCSELQTTKGLGLNRCVELDNCSSLEDVSSLASVPIVTIKYCPRLAKMRYDDLKNVPRLKIIA